MGRIASPALAILIMLGLTPALAQEGTANASACFQQNVPALRLARLDDAIGRCTDIIDDRAAAASLRGEALAQRGLMRGRRWAVLEAQEDATQGIADISESLRLHAPGEERRIQLVLVRAQLYTAIGQTRRATDDFRNVLSTNPGNDIARAGLRRLGQPDL